MKPIPKDGRNYLAWHEIEGHIPVYWAMDGYRFYQYDFEMKINPIHLHRWMDEYGRWHRFSLEDPNDYIGSKFVFPRHNNIAWGMDFSQYSKRCPHDVEFTLRSVLEGERVNLVAPGYGGEPYGNGSIYVQLKDIKPYEVK